MEHERWGTPVPSYVAGFAPDARPLDRGKPRDDDTEGGSQPADKSLISLFDLFAGHEIGRELKAMSQWLDEDRELIGLVAEDLRRHGVNETGRRRQSRSCAVGFSSSIAN